MGMGGEGRESEGRQSSPSIKGCGAVTMEGIRLEEEMRPKGVVKSTSIPEVAPLSHSLEAESQGLFGGKF